MPDLKWTTEVPTEPGWYWVRLGEFEIEQAREIVFRNGKPAVVQDWTFREISDFSHFAGPIPKPSKEKK